MVSEIIPVEPIEVLASFLVSNNVIGFVNEHKSFNGATLQRYIKQQYDFYNKLPKTILEARVHDKNRLSRIFKHRWFLQIVPLKYIGVWPGVGDLPKEWSAFSVLDISKRLEGTNKTLHSVQKIYSMIPYINEILYLLPPILVMGSEIRDINNNQLMPFDADDGSHRCIAAALNGVEEVKCYVGLS
ncbi:MAG: hypothetical protein ABIJ82_03015 [Patescibacteria group bacterium]|nr:hypothetical protein [Patescibacteria group bacterium]MBU1953156.1 hypothetical protein [Patescibacteria group bacterium]